LAAALSFAPRPSLAFTHIVQTGETLASIAEKLYGKIQYEKILVAANALEAEGGIPIVAGMRLEVPAVSYRRIEKNDTWAGLAAKLLGGAHRADVIATANGTHPWLPPHFGAEVVVPYNLRVITADNDTIVGIAYKFMNEKKKAWVLDHYNGLDGRALRRGDVILVPLTDLPLTAEGKIAAREAAGAGCSESAGETRSAQLKVQSEIPSLIADVRGGRYVDAVSRGNRFPAAGELSKPQLGVIHRQLLEAYVALGATGLATAACTEWRKHDPKAALDRTQLSPKLVSACNRGAR
jgi:hypothetical protein